MPDKRAAIYARFSTAHQNESSIDDQLALCRSYAARNGYAVAGEFADRAKSGGSMLGRDGLLDMLARAQRREFDAVIVEALDRISRDMEDLAGLHKRLKFLGVHLVAVHEGRANTILVGLRGLVGQLYREDGAEKVKRGMAGVLRGGRSAGGRCYGYRPVLGRPGELAIIEEEADVVRRIFAAYAAGRSPRDIAGDLNRDGIEPPRGERWNASTINGNLTRGHGMLLNPIYSGRIVWNRVSMIRDPDTGRRVSRPNPEGEWQSADAPHLRIIDGDLWDEVQARKAGRSRQSGEPLHRRKRLLSGLLRCGHCGAGMSLSGPHRGKPRIMCSQAREAGTCTSTKRMPLDVIEQTVIDALRGQLGNPRALAEYVSTFREERRAATATATRDRTQIEKRLAVVAGSIERIVAAVADGVMTGDEAREKLSGLRQERSGLDARLADAVREADVIELHPEAVRAYREHLKTLAAVMGDAIADADPDVIEAFRGLVEGVIVTPGGRYEPPLVEIRGRLAALTGQAIAPAGRYRAGVALELVAEGRCSHQRHIVSFGSWRAERR
jgi:DNA invertase Pin-like site-specific DNA recombinase